MKKPLNCDNCGACCMEQESPPMYCGYLPGAVFEHEEGGADKSRVKRLPPGVIAELQEYIGNLLAANPKPHPTYPACIWLDLTTKRCKHYKQRPDICRHELHCGDEACLRWRKQYGVGDDPPGRA